MANDDKHQKQDGKQGKDGGGHAHGPGRYAVIWGLLLLFTVLTVFTGRMDLHGANLPLALAIASIKAGLVILFFMHLWDSEGINRLVFGVSIIFVFVFVAGVFGDLLTRQGAALPTGAPPPSLEAGAAGVRPAHAPPHSE